MAEFLATARLFTEDDKALPGQRVMIELCDLRSGTWKAVAEAESDRSGIIKAEVKLEEGSTGGFIPALRLVADTNPRQVLSAGPMVSVQGRRRSLMIDFGEIEILGDAQFARRDTSGRNRDMMGGLARKEGTPQTLMLRSFNVNPELAERLAGADLASDERFARPTATTNLGERPVTTGITTAATSAQFDPKLKAEVETLHAINVNNTAKLTEKDRIIATREHELTLKDTQLQTALSRATTAESRATTAETELATLKATNKGKEADIQTVFTNIGSQLGSASSTLKTSANPYRISAVKVDLKGSLSDNGKIVLGGDRVDGSGVSVEMNPDGTTRDGTEVAVPDVTGLTQSAARRVLRSVGLRLKPASQAMTAGTAGHGQSLRQAPAAGTDAPHGSEVLVVFASVAET